MTLIANAHNMLEHHNAIDTFVGDNVYQRLHECSYNKSSIQLPKTSGGNPFHLSVSSSSTDERPAKLPKMGFSHIANLKCSGMSLSTKQLKRRHLLCDEIFECIQIELDYSKEKYKSEYRNSWIVRCCNIDALIEKIFNISGEISVHDLHFKLGLDFVRGFTKLLMCLQNDNSVDNLVYLWVTSAPECNYNFSVMLQDDQIKRLMEEYNVSFTVDLKAASYCLGIMNGHHPCIWCTWDNRRGLDSVQWEERSSAHHLEMFQELQDMYQGDSKNHAIDCDGIEDRQALNVWLVDFMQMFNLPELHLLLGIGQKLYDAILITMSEDEKEHHEAILEKLNIRRSAYHGGAFEGNAMRKITKEVLELGFPKSNSSYITLVKFRDVVDSCFGKHIKGDFKMAVYHFEKSFKQSGLSCSTKVHVPCRHLIPFITNYLPDEMGLGSVSEQAFESAPSRSGRVWETRYKCQEENEKFPECLLNTVSDVNFVNFINKS
ncbi:hypothetical protein LOD99_9244 [Oopsacas minuta]|uniref:Uncharacterized protein n=1 Tax=Oopsacas minuta TaxID=111878 RepID=A0AAV7JCF1_9METZ|nr:hypothetical protein LOD99_9244 [Oopsacas minuta]